MFRYTNIEIFAEMHELKIWLPNGFEAITVEFGYWCKNCVDGFVGKT
jgi:hypothetical protein